MKVIYFIQKTHLIICGSGAMNILPIAYQSEKSRRHKAMYDDIIIVCCLGMRQRFTSRSEAIQRFYNAMENCNNKVEYDSYSRIFCQLMEGKSYCSD